VSGRFRLGVVLRLRQLDEDAARGRLGSAITARLAVVALRNEAAARLASEHAWLAQLQGTRGASAGEMHEAVRAVGGAEAAHVSAIASVAAAEQALIEARARLAQATRRREVVERLRDRHVATERRRDEHAEVLRLADVAAIQYLSQRSGETPR
jgi:flagellar export protein FliJ